MIVLALDTCLFACSAAVVRGGELLARRIDPMARGHQERLAPLVAELMAEAGLEFSRLERVGVTVGPGAVLALLLSAVFVPRGTAR